MADVIRPSLPDPATQPRRPLVARVFDALKLPDVKVESYRLKSALRADDKNAIVKAARNLTSEQRLEVLEQVDEIRKVEETSDLVRGYWNRITRHFDLPAPADRWKFSVAHPRPEQQSGSALPADPSRAVPAGPTKPAAPRWIAPEGTGRRVQVERGGIVHWTTTDGEIHHGKVKSWGQRGITAITRDGDEWGVVWGDVRAGVHESAWAEHQHLVQKSEAAQANQYIRLLTMSPEQRAEHFRLRDGEF